MEISETETTDIGFEILESLKLDVLDISIIRRKDVCMPESKFLVLTSRFYQIDVFGVDSFSLPADNDIDSSHLICNLKVRYEEEVAD